MAQASRPAIAAAALPGRRAVAVAAGVGWRARAMGFTLAAMRSSNLALIAALLFSPFQARAEALVEPSSELSFEKYPTFDGKRFQCLGTGIRKKAIFRVYAIVFCVDEAAFAAQLPKYFEGPGKRHAALRGEELARALGKDPEFFQYLRGAPVDKAIELAFVRNVGAEKMRETFVESLTRALGPGERARIDAFVQMLDRDLKEGDRLALRTTAAGGIHVQLGAPRALDDSKLAGGIWQAYLGPDSNVPTLKESVARGVAALRQ